MKTWSGLDAPPKAQAPSLIDVTFHLGRQRRFGGWGDSDWTVLHHTVLVQLLWLKAEFPHDELAWALLHDAHEAFTTDIPRPVKLRIDGGGHVAELEHEIDAEIATMLQVEYPPTTDARRRIKIIDNAALLLEAALFGPPGSLEYIYARLRLSPLCDPAFDVLVRVEREWLTAVENRFQRTLPLEVLRDLERARTRASVVETHGPSERGQA